LTVQLQQPFYYAIKTNTDADWPEDQTEAAKGSGETKHLWEESWDDDDTSDDFSQQLRYVHLY
jgi:hypothetical protein